MPQIYATLNGDFNEDHALYEFATHCLVSPVSGKKPDQGEAKALIEKMKQRLDVPNATTAEIDKRIDAQKPFGTEVWQYLSAVFNANPV